MGRVLMEEMRRVLSQGLRHRDLPPHRIDLAYKVQDGVHTLNTVQRSALVELSEANGLFGSIGVGHGKTLIGLLAGTIVAAQRPLLLHEACFQPELERQLAKFSNTFRIPANLMTLSYEMLSQPKNQDLLERMSPDLIVADEAHNLGSLTSARTRRVIEYFVKHPTTKFVALSGTITSRSLMDYSHLMELALRERAPVPLSERELRLWSRCTDSWSVAMSKDPPTPVDWKCMEPLLDWAGEVYAGEWIESWTDEQKRGMCRRALHKRLRATAGVIFETGSSYDGSLMLRYLSEKMPPEVESLMNSVHTHQVLPMLEDTPWAQDPFESMGTAALLRQLAQGFFYRWVWPGGVKNKAWLVARREYNKLIEWAIQEGFGDSPATARQELLDRCVEGAAEVIECWQSIESQGPSTEAVWVSDFLIERARLWATQHPRCIIWYAHQAVGEALSKYMPCPEPKELRDGMERVALSIDKFGTGRNLQAWNEALVMCPPSSGKTWEQLIGRMHRQGQLAHHVLFEVYQHAAVFKSALTQAFRDADYLAQTQGVQSKLRLATLL